MRQPMKFNIRSKGKPKFLVWLFNKDTNKWDCWGEVATPDDYPNIVERVNNGEFLHTTHGGNTNYSKVYYQRIEDVGKTPNRLGIV